MKVFYAGIGSRQTPADVLNDMKVYAAKIVYRHPDVILRSGGAKGADQAFEHGCDFIHGQKEIYLPWKDFEGNQSSLYEVREEAMHIAKQYHPVWDSLSKGAQKLLARNVYQIIGMTLDKPVRFVLCWTADGCVSGETRTPTTGGTGLAIELAARYSIPVFNLKNGMPKIDELSDLIMRG